MTSSVRRIAKLAAVLGGALLAACSSTAAPPARGVETFAAPTPVATASAPIAPTPGAPLPAAALSPLTLAGCPPPPSPPPPPHVPWHPAHLVPDAQLPAVPAATGHSNPLGAIEGKGMWIWQWPATEHGDAQAIVDRAHASGLDQLWVRVADSRDGFYGGDALAQLVPVAHNAGIAVIAWGFPHLYDPATDAAWSTSVLDWRSAAGDSVDGFAADIETSSEGVALSALRVQVYLGLVRPARHGRPLIATVFPPSDYWLARYPFDAMAPYVDAFAPMLYWGCKNPGDLALTAVRRLSPLRPVHVIGQAFDFADVGGRRVAPSAVELERFMSVARLEGAVGASFWVWQHMNAEEWGELAAYPWSATARSPAARDGPF